LENVHRRTHRLVARYRKLPYEDRLSKLGITTLAKWRIRGDLVQTYKIVTGKNKVHCECFFQPYISEYNTRGHRYRSRLEIRRNFFSQRVIHHWNNSTRSFVSADTVNTFKNRLDKCNECMGHLKFFGLLSPSTTSTSTKPTKCTIKRLAHSAPVPRPSSCNYGLDPRWKRIRCKKGGRARKGREGIPYFCKQIIAVAQGPRYSSAHGSHNPKSSPVVCHWVNQWTKVTRLILPICAADWAGHPSVQGAIWTAVETVQQPVNYRHVSESVTAAQQVRAVCSAQVWKTILCAYWMQSGRSRPSAALLLLLRAPSASGRPALHAPQADPVFSTVPPRLQLASR